ncbi:MAG: iron-containing alcohol dehydrogenase family protein [Sphaerochaetaceae bacterium]|nr:iron-containing alcohol dehydrogenase family protein [Sphaerochaetaceae bacterium]
MIQQYYMPVKVVSGRNCLMRSSKTFRQFGTKAIIICGYSSAEKNGSLADVRCALESSQIGYEIFRGIAPNPTVQQVFQVSEISRANDCDFVIAIGGGSVIDAAKVVAILTKNDLTEDELFTRQEFDSVLPLVAVPTTAGTGSEVTQYSILTNVQKETKSFVISEKIFPQMAFLDGKYLENLPEETTIHTAVDALSHAVEGYLAVRATSHGRILALESIKLLAPALKKLYKGEILSVDERDQLLYASMLAGIVISQSGTTAVHAVGYSLTYFKLVDHGRANGLLMPSYLDFLSGERKNEVQTILDALGLSSVQELRTMCSKLLTPQPLTEEEIVKFSQIAIEAKNIENTTPRPTIKVLKRMLKDASELGE